MVVVVLPLQVPYASPYHVAEHTSEYFHNNEYHHNLTAYRLVGAEICRNYRGDAHQCHDRRYMSDGCHDEVDDKSKRYNLVKHYGLFKPCRPLHCHVHYAGAFDQLCHDAKRRYGDPQRHALHQIEHKNDSRRHPQKGRQCVQRDVAATYQSDDVHRYSQHQHRQAEHEKRYKAQPLLPVVAALVKK